MSMNLFSIHDRVAFRVGHVSVAYKGTVLLWGGSRECPQMSLNDMDHIFPSDELCIFNCYTETWHIRTLSGDIPPKLTCACGAILGDALYIYGGYILQQEGANADELYKLDLLTMKWHRLNPGGLKPVACNKLVAWTYGQRIYLFGGYGDWGNQRLATYIGDGHSGCAWNNQLVAYNAMTDRWEWPITQGEAPLPRAAHAGDISGSLVFIMGGRLLDVRMNDLYRLNMENMTWSANLTPECPEPKPEGRSWHSLNFITRDKAVLYGGLDSETKTLDDCWILEISEPIRYRFFNSIFNTKRFWHRMVYNHATGDLVSTGGTYEDIPGFILTSYQPKTLLRLAVDAVLDEAARLRPSWRELPVGLKNLLETREAMG